MRLIEPGSVLANRYVVEDMLAETGHAESWRAFDQVLARSVVLQLVASSSPYAERLLATAKRASRVTDPRILQVLDAVDDGGLTYVVREWVSGQSLTVLLAEGPLPARRAAWLLRELADALAQAHALGVAHGCLDPDVVVTTSGSGVKIVGLATLAVLSDLDQEADPERADTVALGRLLYACLTARWPGPDSRVLPPAPTERGRYLHPRQVRAGVPRSLDELCDRILSPAPRSGEPLTTAAQVKDALTHILAGDRSSASSATQTLSEPAAEMGVPTATDVRPALLPADDDALPAPTPSGATSETAGSRLPFRLIVAAVAVLVTGTALLAYLVGHHGVPQGTSSEAAPRSPSTPAPTLRRIQIQGATSFDPYPGSGDENPALVPLAIDGDPTTAWQTLPYLNYPALGNLKDGVGLVLDLGAAHDVSRVAVELQGSPTSLQLRAAPASAAVAPANSAQQYRLLASRRGAGTSVVFRLQPQVSTRFLLVWLTSLPPDGTNAYRGRISEIKVFG